MEFDNEASLQEARRGLPLKKLMQQYGKAPENERWHSFRCSFCNKKGKASVFAGQCGDLFKCFSAGCPSGTSDSALDEVGFLALVLHLSRKDAFVAYLKQAGVWKEAAQFKRAEASTTRSPSPPENSTPQQAQSSNDVRPDEASPALDPAIGPLTPAIVPAFGEAPARPEVPVLPVQDGTGLGVVRRFYERLELTATDEEMTFRKRGLETRTIAALGFRSNPRSNEQLLQPLIELLERDELLASGLFLRKPDSSELRINKQFCGYGIKGRKKPAAPHGEPDVEQDEHDKWEWDWTHPILIPYLDPDGNLSGLRPHKGMGRRATLVGTPRLYVPRVLKSERAKLNLPPEEFHNVILTEGEFKAAALWQTVGAGRMDALKPWGVAALPGISFVKNYEIREQLAFWLKLVRAQRVIVVFDNEEKGNKALPGYKADFRHRYDAQKCARYLATDLAHKLQCKGEVGLIPDRWRDDKGKADWDGMLSRIVNCPKPV